MWAAIWFKWLTIGYYRHFHIKAVFVLAFNLVCLACVDDHLARGLFLVIALCSANAVLAMHMFKKRTDVLKDNGFTAKNVYHSFEKPMLQITFIFIGQIVLIIFFVYSMYEKLHFAKSLDEDDPRDMAYVFWISAYITVQMSTIYNRGDDSAVGGVFEIGLWEDLLEICNHVHIQAHKHNVDGDGDNALDKPLGTSKFFIAIRMFMDFIINGLAREIISTVIPIVLMKSADPLSFVMNSLAVTFISTLDDMSDVRFKVTENVESEESRRILKFCCVPDGPPRILPVPV